VPLAISNRHKTESFAIRAEQRRRLKEEEKRKAQLFGMMNSAIHKMVSTSSPSRKKEQKGENEMKKREYDHRYLFVLVDGQDLFANESLKLIKVEINAKLCRMIPTKTWEAKAARTLNLMEKLALTNPSKVLQHQALLEVIEEVNQRMPDLPLTMYYAWTL
jgi:hypothetical protein